MRSVGERDGLTRTQAEREFRRLQEGEEQTPRPRHDAEIPTVDAVADSLRQKLALRGAGAPTARTVPRCSACTSRRT